MLELESISAWNGINFPSLDIYDANWLLFHIRVLIAWRRLFCFSIGCIQLFHWLKNNQFFPAFELNFSELQSGNIKISCTMKRSYFVFNRCAWPKLKTFMSVENVWSGLRPLEKSSRSGKYVHRFGMNEKLNRSF